MTADHSSESGRQRTVAELLEQYGGDGGGGGRRRRRSGRADDAEPATRSGELPTPDSAAAADAERTWSSLSAVSAEEQDALPRRQAGGQAIADSAGTFSGAAVPDRDSAGSPWTGYGSAGLSGAGTFDTGSGDSHGGSPLDSLNSSEWARPGTGWSRSGADPLSSPSSPSGTGSYPAADPYSADSYKADPYKADSYKADPYKADSYKADSYLPDAYLGESYPVDGYPSKPAKPPERPTETMPRIGRRPGTSTGPITNPLSPTGLAALKAGPIAPVEMSPGAPDVMGPGAMRTGATRAVEASGPSTQVSSPAVLFDDGDDDGDLDHPGARPVAGKRGRTKRSARGSMVDVPAGLDVDDAGLEDRSAGWKAWAILIAQGIGGAVGGAVLWVGFRYLWLNLPVVALAAAVLATVGLVMVVRTIRGSDDLQTTMLAVLVGLIVTISPAVLLLAVR
ncbi:MAG TPA: hypothetical protein VGP05_18915 [Pseudonocardia sp.]|nr:hypothetical protein [Pseudonocardia sp.]